MTPCFRAVGWDSLLADAGGGIGHLGYEGTRLVTPKKRPAGGTLAEPDRTFNTRLAKIRGSSRSSGPSLT